MDGKPGIRNNAVIVSDKSDLDIALRSVYFGAIGTSGQRCTSTRRVIVQERIAKELTERLVRAYADRLAAIVRETAAFDLATLASAPR